MAAALLGAIFQSVVCMDANVELAGCRRRRRPTSSGVRRRKKKKSCRRAFSWPARSINEAEKVYAKLAAEYPHDPVYLNAIGIAKQQQDDLKGAAQVLPARDESR